MSDCRFDERYLLLFLTYSLIVLDNVVFLDILLGVANLSIDFRCENPLFDFIGEKCSSTF